MPTWMFVLTLLPLVIEAAVIAREVLADINWSVFADCSFRVEGRGADASR